MESPPGRLLRLLSLLQSRSEISGPELGEHLGVSTRTVRRDIDRLRTMGYPVDSAVGINGSYRLAAGAEVPPMLFDRDEVVSLTVALRRLHGSGIGPMSGAAARALRKLERVLPPGLARQAETLAAMTVTVGEVVDPALTPAAMARIASACSERLQLRFGYVDRDGAATERRVEPLRLVSMGRNWYLVAFDLDRRDWRTFRIDRLELDGTEVGHRFEQRAIPGGDVAAFVERRIARPWSRLARVRFFAPAERVQRWLPTSQGFVEPEAGDRCVAVVNGHDPVMLANSLIVFGVDFEVIEAEQDVVAALASIGERVERARRASTAT